jgi:Icc-related predicted phosphoesterase
MRAKMIVDAISDLHGHYPKLEGGDLLIVAGDLTARDLESEHALFDYWINEQPYKKKIVIAGNHDNVLAEERLKFQFCEYLCDSGTEFEYQESVRNLFDRDDKSLIYKKKLKIWGSPWSLWFEGINPECKAFTGSENDLKKKFDLIPDDIDILITHSPPYGILDGIPIEDGSEFHTGSQSLQKRLFEIRPRLNIFGHIHEKGHRFVEITFPPEDQTVKQISEDIIKVEIHGGKITWCVNASHVNEHYKPVNKPVRVIL